MNEEKDNQKSFDDTINTFEEKLSLKAGFSADLIREDDWSFIIKAHALLEAAVSHLLTGVVNIPEFHNVFSQLELSNKKTGKMAFVKSLNLLKVEARSFIQKLSELRNELAHSVSNVNFDLDNYVSELDTNQKRAFSKAIKYFSPDETFQFRGQNVEVATWVIQNPKLAIWFSLMNLFSVIYLQQEFYDLDKQLNKIKSKISRQETI